MTLVEELPMATYPAGPAESHPGIVEGAAAAAIDRSEMDWTYTAHNDSSRVESWRRYSDAMVAAGVETGEFAASYRDSDFNVLTGSLTHSSDLAGVTTTTTIVEARPVTQNQLAQSAGSRKYPEGSSRWWREVGGLGTAVAALVDRTYFKERLRGRLPRVRRAAALLSLIQYIDIG